MDEENTGFTITWDDEHVSSYSFDWLKKRSFTEKTHQERLRFFNQEPDRVYWSSGYIQENLPVFQFDQVLVVLHLIRHLVFALIYFNSLFILI